jgi:putative addiction module component (TIGR02574 family)
MPRTLDLLEAEAMKLSPQERAELAERLLESVNDAPPLSLAWRAEIERRLADLDAGRTETIPGEQVFAETRALIESRRKP